MATKYKTISAHEWNEYRKKILEARPLSGTGIFLHEGSHGVTVSATYENSYQHPWSMSPRYEDKRWQTTVKPGFVNEQDASIDDKFLTDEDPPLLVLSGFRNPAASDGIGVSESGELVVAAAEGYPEYFERMGAVPSMVGGIGLNATKTEYDESRTRQIRACDIVLVTPRYASRQTVDVMSPTIDATNIMVTNTVVNNRMLSAPSPHYLKCVPKFVPYQSPTFADRLLGIAEDSETDEILIATIYFLSTPNAPEDSVPDETWAAFPVYFVFWNLAHATRREVPENRQSQITFPIAGLAAGVTTTLVNGILSPINESYNLIMAALDNADFSGTYWSVGGVGMDPSRPRKREIPQDPDAQKQPDGFGLDATARRIAREDLKAEEERDIPTLNPKFPFKKTPFTPGFFPV